MEKLLARIKALFEPNRPGAPPSEVEETLLPAAAVPESAETGLPALIPPTATVEEPAPAGEVPAVVDEAPIVPEEAPSEDIQPMASTDDVQPMAPAATAGALTLRLESERGSRSIFEVTKSGATIGRGPESSIQLADLSVSRKHAKITYRQGAYWLSDLGSMGGTWIDGTKLAAPRRVATGQTIDIGLCRLTVVSAGADEEAPEARGPSHAARSR